MTQKERDARNRSVLKHYASGMGVTELAKTFHLSRTTISTILNREKTEQCQEKTGQNPKKARKAQSLVARSIVEKATDALADMEFEKMHPDTLLKIIERLTVLYRGFDDTAHSERQMLKEYVDALNAYANGGADK